MGLSDELKAEVRQIFATQWAHRQVRNVPNPENVRLGNDAALLAGATVLYADLAESTDMVDRLNGYRAAEIYKSYLHCAAKIIRSEGGDITAFDGDRIMSVFVGTEPNNSATRAGMKLCYAVRNFINPALRAQYSDESYVVKQAVGIDFSKLLVAQTGIRGSNDLVWIGRAANYAAKLCSLRESEYVTWITKDVFDRLTDEMKVASDGRHMWEARTWTAKGIIVYRSNFGWTF